MRFAVIAVLVSGCFSPSFESGDLRCEEDATCPPGFHCASDDTCWRNGENPTPDMSVPIGDMGPSLDLAASPPDLVPPCGNAGWKCVFVTSEQYTGNLGGLNGADLACQMLANQSHLGGTYKAWLSDGTNSPSTRFTMAAVPYRLVDHTIIANDWSGLIGASVDMGLLHGISLTEQAMAPPLGTDDCAKTTPVWSNTDRNGVTFMISCSGWLSASVSAKGGQGAWGQTTGGWTDVCGGSACSGVAALYCFEQ